jgi:hypothetical protein
VLRQIRENKFSHKYHISVAATDNRHRHPPPPLPPSCRRHAVALPPPPLPPPRHRCQLQTNWQPPHNAPLPLPATTDIIATAHSRTPAYFLSSANFAVATLLPPLTTSPLPTSNVTTAVYVDAVSTAANKN